MGKIERLEDLEIWRLAREMCKDVYVYTKRTPFVNDFKLRDQIRGSSGSVMDNIAEGFERNGNREFIQFLSISKGSAGETRSQLYRALDQEYISKEEFDSLYERLNHLSAKIGTFISYLKNSGMKGAKFKKLNKN